MAVAVAAMAVAAKPIAAGAGRVAAGIALRLQEDGRRRGRNGRGRRHRDQPTGVAARVALRLQENSRSRRRNRRCRSGKRIDWRLLNGRLLRVADPDGRIGRGLPPPGVVKITTVGGDVQVGAGVQVGVSVGVGGKGVAVGSGVAVGPGLACWSASVRPWGAALASPPRHWKRMNSRRGSPGPGFAQTKVTLPLMFWIWPANGPSTGWAPKRISASLLTRSAPLIGISPGIEEDTFTPRSVNDC